MTLTRAKEYLKEQAAYVKKLAHESGGWGIFSPELILSLRNLGYKNTAKAIAEFIDNAIQAFATEIMVIYSVVGKNKQYSQNHVGSIAIVDNGGGMEPDMIRAALKLGGTHRFDNREGIGRFGIGLPGAAGSQTKTYQVYSKLEEGKWWVVKVDLNKLVESGQKSGEVFVPEPMQEDPPTWVAESEGYRNLKHGTVVLLDNPDNLTSGYVRPSAFYDNIIGEIGTTYRNYLSKNTIFVQYVDATSKKGLEDAQHDVPKIVHPVDPLFLREDALYYEVEENSHRATGLTEMVIDVKTDGGKNQYPIRCRFSHMDMNFARKIDGGYVQERTKVLNRNAGQVIIMRNGRQMAVLRNTDFPKSNLNTAYNNNDRFWQWELDFPAELDEDFDVTMNKQYAQPSARIWDILQQNNLPQIIKQLRKLVVDTKTAKDIKKAEDTNPMELSSEILTESEKFEPKDDAPPGELSAIKILRNRLIDGYKIKGYNDTDAVQRADEKIKRDKHFFTFETMDGAPFYRAVMQTDGRTEIRINTAHPFYSQLYAAPKTNERHRRALEILLGVLGRAELRHIDSDGERWYKAERARWSHNLEIALTILQEKDPIPEVDYDDDHDVDGKPEAPTNKESQEVEVESTDS